MFENVLYSPWRMKYILAEKNNSCIFCLPQEQDAEHFVVHRSEHSFVILNLFPYNNGHLMVVPLRHVALLGDLSIEETANLFALVRRTEIVLRKIYHPEGINVGINIGKAAGAGIDDHLHIHLIPRWEGDTNFMTSVSGTRVIPEDFTKTYQVLKAGFDNEECK